MSGSSTHGVDGDEMVVDVRTMIVEKQLPAPIENRYLLLIKEGKLTAVQRIPLEDGRTANGEETSLQSALSAKQTASAESSGAFHEVVLSMRTTSASTTCLRHAPDGDGSGTEDVTRRIEEIAGRHTDILGLARLSTTWCSTSMALTDSQPR